MASSAEEARLQFLGDEAAKTAQAAENPKQHAPVR